MTAAILILSVIYFGFSALKFRSSLICFVFLLAFTPRYVGIGVGADGLALSLRRILLLIVALNIAVRLILNSRKAWQALSLLKRIKSFMSIVALLYISKLISTLINGDGHDLFYYVDDLLSAIVPIYICAYLCVDHRGYTTIIHTLLISLVFSTLLSIPEKILGHPLLSGLASVDVAIRFQDPLSGRFRDDAYRVMAGFESTLLFASFCVFALWVCATYVISYERRKKWALIIPLTAFAMILTQSRAAYVSLAITAIFAATLWILRSVEGRSKPGMALVAIGLVVLSSIASYHLFISPMFGSLQFATDQASSSTNERLSQFAKVGSIFVEQPLLGYGLKQSYIGDFDQLRSIDNYYLVLLLQGGLFALCLNLAMKMYVLIKICDAYVKKRVGTYSLGLAMGVAAMCVSDFFISLTSNLPYLYIISTMALIAISNANRVPKSGYQILNA